MEGEADAAGGVVVPGAGFDVEPQHVHSAEQELQPGGDGVDEPPVEETPHAAVELAGVHREPEGRAQARELAGPGPGGAQGVEDEPGGRGGLPVALGLAGGECGALGGELGRIDPGAAEGFGLRGVFK